MNTLHYTVSTGQLATDLSLAVSGGYIKTIPIGGEWGAYKGTGFALDSCSPDGGRFHLPLQTGYYFGSGERCCFNECRQNVIGKVFCRTQPVEIKAFDLHAFASDFGYGDLFVQSEASGGYDAPRYAAQFIQQQFNVTGIMYESYAMKTIGDSSLCLAILPNSGQTFSTSIYVLNSGAFATSSSIFF